MIKKIFLWLIVLVVVAIVAVYFVRNYMVERAVEAGGTYALGVPTDLGSAGLAIRGGSLELNNLEVRNPEGFTAENFLSLRHGFLDVDAGSVLDDEVVVDSLIIEGATLNLEQIDNKGNYRVLMDNIKKVELGESSEKEQKFRVGLVAVRDVQVTGALTLMGKKYEKSYSVENITLRNVGSDNGATVGQITATVVQAIVSKALAAGSGILPEGFGKGLSDLKDEGLQKIESEATDKLKDLGKSLTGDKK